MNLIPLSHACPLTFKYTHGKTALCASYVGCFLVLCPTYYHSRMLAHESHSVWYILTYKAQVGLAHKAVISLEISDPSLWVHARQRTITT